MLDDLGFMDLVGVIGSLTICAAYYAVSAGRLAGNSMRYQWMNAVGSILLLVSLYFRPNPGAILIEVLWLLIAVTAMLRIRRERGS